MNRILKRPMFRMGGSSGTGITSGLDRPQQMAKGGRIGYQQGTMPNFQLSGLPGFATQFGLNLLSTPPQGNIFQTAAVAAQDPFRRLQAGQAAEMKTASDRAFAEKLAKDERDFLRGETTRKLESAERIAGMNVADTSERVQDIADTKYEGDIIKAQREVDFPTEVYPNLVSQYGNKQVATTVIDSTNLQKQKDIDKFVDLNPFLASKFVYDVATGKTMTFVKDKLSGRFKLIPADSADIDTTGEDMPAPKTGPDFTYFSPETKRKLEELRSEFSDEFYQGS